MSEKKGPLWKEEKIAVLSRDAVLAIDEIMSAVGESADLQDLRDLLDLTLHRALADKLDSGGEELKKKAWQIADNVIFTWMAFQAPELKAKFAYLFKRVGKIYGDGWDYFDLLATRKAREGLTGMYFEAKIDDEQGDQEGFADLDRLNRLTPTLEIRQKNWLSQPMEYRREYISKRFADQIKDALNTVGRLGNGQITDLADVFELGDEMVVALANLDYKELCRANVVADLITALVRKKVGLEIGFCINKTASDGITN